MVVAVVPVSLRVKEHWEGPTMFDFFQPSSFQVSALALALESLVVVEQGMSKERGQQVKKMRLMRRGYCLEKVGIEKPALQTVTE